MLIEIGHVLSHHLNISNFLVQISETLKKKKKKRIVSREHHHLRAMLFQTHSDTQIHFFITVID